MAQTHSQQFPSQPFSPPISSPSPGAPSPVGSAPPPKRQRLSPLPQQPQLQTQSQPQSQAQSPYGSPSFGTLQLPPVGTPVNGAIANGMSGTLSPTPLAGSAIAPPPPGSMGPPSRPVEKATDTAELTDVLASSGIDVKEEEAYLTGGYGTASTQQPQVLANTSFGSQASTTATISANNSFAEPTPLKQPSFQGYYPQESPSQATAAPKRPEPTQEDQQHRENTRAARRDQYHLQNPFLWTKVLENKLQSEGHRLGVRTPSEGLYHPVTGNSQPIEVIGPDGSSMVHTGKTILNLEHAPLVDILSLLSIACRERLRGVVDHSATLAKNRRTHSHGAVPQEWTDLAVDATASPRAVTPMKRSRSATQEAPGDGTPKTTVPNALTNRLRKVVDKDVSFEDSRATKRAKRSANAILGGNTTAGSAGGSPSGAATPSAFVSERAPDVVDKKTTKKELKRQAEAKATEAVQHKHAVETARMATNSLLSGNMFGKKTYSWLKGPSTGGSGFSSPSRMSTGPGVSSPASGPTSNEGASGPGAAATNSRRFGDFREDGERGAGIQVRDVLFTLELDGRGARHIQKAFARDSRDEKS